MVSEFLLKFALRPTDFETPSRNQTSHQQVPANQYPPRPNTTDFSGVILFGQTYQAGSAKDAMIRVLDTFQKQDPTFLDRFAALPKHGRTRRYISKDRSRLYPCREDLCKQYSEKHFGDWWVGTNYSKTSLRDIIETACEVVGAKFGKEIQLI
jgi:hypothetical protein